MKFFVIISRGFIFLWILLYGPLFFWAPPVKADENDLQKLRRNYQQLVSSGRIEAEDFPFILESDRTREIQRATIYTLLKSISFETFKAQLTNPGQWCKFIPLHLNIKACVTLKQNNQTKLRFYIGRKFYVTPEKASPLELNFNASHHVDHLMLSLDAKTGPYGSSDYHFIIQAIPVVEGVFMRFELSNRPGLAEKLGKIYFLTTGRKKVGFSIIGKNWRGEPQYVRGQDGASERNIVRYILTLKTFFDSLQQPPEQRFEYTIKQWFEMTERYARQLHELDQETYLSSKRREQKNQLLLQHAIDTNVAMIFTPSIETER